MARVSQTLILAAVTTSGEDMATKDVILNDSAGGMILNNRPLIEDEFYARTTSGYLQALTEAHADKVQSLENQVTALREIVTLLTENLIKLEKNLGIDEAKQ